MPHTVDEVAATLAAACEYLDVCSRGSRRVLGTHRFTPRAVQGKQSNSISASLKEEASVPLGVPENNPAGDSPETFSSSALADNPPLDVEAADLAGSPSGFSQTVLLASSNSRERIQCPPGAQRSEKSRAGGSLKVPAPGPVPGKRRQDKTDEDAQEDPGDADAQREASAGERVNGVRQLDGGAHSDPTGEALSTRTRCAATELVESGGSPEMPPEGRHSE